VPFWAKNLSLTRDIFLYLDYVLSILLTCKVQLDKTLKNAIFELYELDLDCEDWEDQVEHIDELRRAVKETIAEIHSNIQSIRGKRIPDVSNLIML